MGKLQKGRALLALALAAPLAFTAPAALAGPVAAGFDSTVIPANDDGSYGPAVSPGFAMNFFGTTYSNFYVNNNGNITFSGNMGTYTPYGLGAGYVGQPIIAPFFADVDTRGFGSGLTAFGTGTYAGRDAFGVSWRDVGYYGYHTDKLNTFQLILTDRSDIGIGDFDIYFNYDTINWETGDASGGSGGLGGVSAAAGFSNGTGMAGTYYQLPGSLVNGALLDGGSNALVRNTNTGVLGQYRFTVRNGVVDPGDPGAIPEPATWAMMIIGFGAAGTVLRRRRTLALA
jgi:hypothetical protein